jgi:hypothetical protein
MAKKKHNKDKKLHNSDDKLHNSDDPDLTWQEKADLLSEDEAEGGPEIYYFTDEDDNVDSHEFLAQELILDESEVEGSPKRKPLVKLQKLKPGAVDIISLVRSDEARKGQRVFDIFARRLALISSMESAPLFVDDASQHHPCQSRGGDRHSYIYKRFFSGTAYEHTRLDHYRCHYRYYHYCPPLGSAELQSVCEAQKSV